MEVVGIVASLIGISELGLKISKSLVKIGTSLVKAQQQISSLARELTNISSAFDLLAGVLKNSEDVIEKEALLTTEALLDDCKITYDEINTHVSAIEGRSVKAKERITWPFRKAKVKELQKRLESSKASLSLMVNILNLGTSISLMNVVLLSKKQPNPSNESVDKAREQFEQSTSAVIEVQLAFDEASRSEVRAIEDAESRCEDPESASTSEQWALSRVGLRQERLVEDIPAFKELSLTRLGTPTHDERPSGQASHELERQYTSQERYDQVKEEAPLIVQQLLICWTNIEDDQFLDARTYQRPGPATTRAGESPPSDPGVITPNAPYDKHPPNSEISPGWTRITEYFANNADSKNRRGASMNTTLNSFSANKTTGSVTQASPQMSDEQEEPDVLYFTLPGFCKNLPLHFKPFSIEERRVTIGDIKRIVDLLGWRPNQFASNHFVRLFYKGTLLQNENLPARTLGIKYGSKIQGEHLIWRPNDTAIPFLRTRNVPDPSQARVRPTYSKPSVEEDSDGSDSSNPIRNSKGPSLVQSSFNKPPPPRSSNSAFPNHTVAPTLNPSFGSSRYTKFAKTDTEAKQARKAAEQWEKAKDDAENKGGTFRAWEQMKSNINQQSFRLPPRPKPPQDHAGFPRPTDTAIQPNEGPRPKPSWEQFPGPQSGFPEVRTQSTRKKQGFAPSIPGAGDEPMARNISAYLHVSRGDRPQTTVPQSYFDTSSSSQAPTSRNPLRHSRSHSGADDSLSTLEKDRPDGRYAQAGIGEKTALGGSVSTI